MSEIHDGGPAFPMVESGELYTDRKGNERVGFESSSGMSLRDYFAAKALTGWYSGDQMLPSDQHMDRYATHFYAMADAMLKAREAKS